MRPLVKAFTKSGESGARSEKGHLPVQTRTSLLTGPERHGYTPRASMAGGLSVRRAALISVNALFAVSAIGVFVRLAVIVALLFLLDRFAFFSPSAFALAVVPATVLLLVFEMKVFAGPLGRELVLPPRDEEKVAP